MLRRREFVAAAPLALASCSRKRPGVEPPRVSILRAADYGSQLYDTIRRALAAHQLDVRGKRVLLKPNLVEFDLFPDFERVFTDLNTDAVTRVRLAHASSKLAERYLPHTALAADLLVSIPKMKTHHWVAATLSLKNLFGLVPGAVYGWPKNVLHWAGIHESIPDLPRALPRAFAPVDGIVGMDGNGPIQCRAKHAGVIVRGPAAPAVDATCCRIMGIDPAKVRYLQIAAGGELAEESIAQLAKPIRAVSVPFQLLPEFQSVRLKQAV